VSTDTAPWPAARSGIRSNSFGVGLATGAYGVGFGVFASAGGFDIWQTQVLSLLMFTGASQFALVGVIASGGTPIAAIATSLLLGSRNTLYGLHMARVLRPRGWRRVAAAHLTIDESTAMSVAQEGTDPAAERYGFWAAGLSVFVCWNITTLVGSLGAEAFGDPKVIGLDAAIPAAFLALLWPRLQSRSTWAIAAAAAAVAMALTPLLRPGLPVLATAVVALIAAYRAVPTPSGEVSD